MTLERLKKLTIWFVYATIIATPLFYFKRGVYPYLLGKTLVFQAIVEILFAAWFALAVLDPRYRPRWTPVTKALAILLGAFVLTSLTGQDMLRSFWSSQERVSGVVMLLHLGAFALAVSSLSFMKDLDWQKLLRASLYTSAFISALAFLQLYIPNLLLVENVGNRPGATFGNPTFFAGYLSFHIFIAIYFLLEGFRSSDGRGKSGGWMLPILALIMQGVALFITQTRGDILGVAAGGIVLVALLAFQPLEAGPAFLRTRRIYIALIALIVIGIPTFWFTRTSSIWKPVPGLNRFADISLEDQSLQPRLIAARSAWKGFLDKPILGWGWENFNIVYNKYYDPHVLEVNYQETRFDKPHNLFLEYLVSGGVVLFAAFAIFIFFIIREAFRLKNSHLRFMIVGAVAAYLVRSFFVFDTIGPLLALYLCAAVLDSVRRQETLEAMPPAQEKGQEKGIRARPFISGGIVLAGVLLAYGLNILSIQATYYQFYGYTYFIQNHPAKALASFKKAVGTFTPYAWNLKRDYATAVAEAYFYNPGVVPKEDAVAAVSAMEEVAREHPKDAFNHYALIDIYNQVYDIDPAHYLDAAEREAQAALALSPDRQEIYFSLAKTRSLRNDYKGARELLEHAMDLDPKVPDSHFYLGLIAYAGGDDKTGYSELKTAMDMGRPWKNYYEPRTVANFFADSEHLGEARDLYQVVLSLHEDPEARLKLGIIYYYQGDLIKAQENVSKVLKENDISKLSGYQNFVPILREMGFLP